MHALELRMAIAELPTPYKERPEGSSSKLRTYKDGLRILKTIAILLKEERPLPFFFWLFGLLAVTSVALAWPVIAEFMRTGLVPRFPTAILATGIMLLAFHSLFCGLTLATVTLGRREMKRMAYLAHARLRPRRAHGHPARRGETIARARTGSAGKLPGRIVLLFQPAEENGPGAARVVEEGVLDAWQVDYVLGLHLWSYLPRGIALVPAGPVMASADEFR